MEADIAVLRVQDVIHSSSDGSGQTHPVVVEVLVLAADAQKLDVVIGAVHVRRPHVEIGLVEQRLKLVGDAVDAAWQLDLENAAEIGIWVGTVIPSGGRYNDLTRLPFRRVHDDSGLGQGVFEGVAHHITAPTTIGHYAANEPEDQK